MKPQVVVAADDFAQHAAALIAEQIRVSLASGSCTLALCGGSTPRPVFERLALQQLRWAGVRIFFGDERAVPPDHRDSNYRMARNALLDRVNIPPAQIFRMEAERIDRAAAALEYDRLLPPALDILLLGVGPDGHTASLFPHSSSLAEHQRRVLAVDRPPLPLEPQCDRMTITPPVIVAARNVMVMVAGTDKSAVVARIIDGPDCDAELPAQLARRGTWILDAGAARHLQSGDS